MKTRIIVLLFCVAGVSAAAAWIHNIRTAAVTVLTPLKTNFDNLWQEVEALEHEGKYKSALDKVDEILTLAREEKNHQHAVKGVVFKLKYSHWLEEDDYIKAIALLDDLTTSSPEPLKQIMHSVTGTVYMSYLNENGYKYYNRTATDDMNTEDIRTWDLKTLVNAAKKEFELSMANSHMLKVVSLKEYSEIILPENAEFEYRPTLYDLLIERVISFYRSTSYYLASPADQTKITTDKYLKFLEEFSALEFNLDDSTSSRNLYALKYFADWLTFHKNDKDKRALIEIELDRLEFARGISVLNDGRNDTLYAVNLRDLLKRYSSTDLAPRIAHDLGAYYSSLSSKYKPFDEKNKVWKWENKRAVTLLEKYAKMYPNAVYTVNCQIMADNIKTPSIGFNSERYSEPGKKVRMVLNWKNRKTLYFNVYKFSDRLMHDRPWRAMSDTSDIYDYLITQKPIRSFTKELPEDGDYLTHTYEVVTDPLDHGYYIILASDHQDLKKSEQLAYTQLYSTRLSYSTRVITNGVQLIVSNGYSGEPLKDVKVTLYGSRYNQIKREYEMIVKHNLISDADGMVKYPLDKESSNYFVELESKELKEKVFMPEQAYTYRNYESEKEKYKLYLFTDRAIYRPGQTIYFKGILSQPANNNKEKAATSVSVDIAFNDPNGETVTELKVTTNKFGSFSGSFTAPFGRLNGTYYIDNEYGTHYVRVEEYKRPRFEVEPIPLKNAYKLGDSVHVEGKAMGYAGNPIDGAKVKYWITRTISFPSWKYWRYDYGYNSEKSMASGELITDADGKYRIPFLLTPDSTIKKEEQPSFHYNVRVEVTDITGETRSTSHYLTAAYHTLNMYVNFPGAHYRNEKARYYYISTTNMSGKKISGKGNISIHKLNAPENPELRSLWSRPEFYELKETEYKKEFPLLPYGDPREPQKYTEGPAVIKIPFNTAQLDSFETNLSTLVPGKYRIILTGTDSLGNPAEHRQDMMVYDAGNGKPAEPEFFIASHINHGVKAGEKAQLLLSSAHNIHVRMDIEKDNKILETRQIILNKEQKLIEFDVTKEMEGNATIHFLCISERTNLSRNMSFYVAHSNTDLKLKFETFRNKLLPGSKEEWKIKITGENKEAVAAELLAVMYDQSLDAFAANYFSFYPHGYSYTRFYWSSNTNQYVSGYGQWRINRPYKHAKYPEIPYMNWFNSGYEYGYGYGYGVGGMSRSAKGNYYAAPSGAKRDGGEGNYEEYAEAEMSKDEAASPVMEKSVDGKELQATGSTMADVVTLDGDIDNRNGQSVSGKLDKVQARSNLNETAFFMPHLTTDASGNVILNFTMPESLTKWKFLALAHTPDFKYGHLFEEVVTQKELMVLPNFPRFLREGDRIEMSAKVSNLTKKDINGTAKLMLFDARTMQPIDALFNHKAEPIQFTAKAGQSAPLFWSINVPAGTGAIICRMVAEGDQHTDGEEMLLPVLTNSVLVTETLPLTVKGKGKKEFTFARMNDNQSNTLRNQSYTLEFTANPAWYAIQALPYMMEYPYECNEQIFTRLYANALAAHVANSNPNIRRVFDQWKNDPSQNALTSNLEKNQELKTLLLEETPWVMEAKNESERKKRIGLLMDVNKMSGELGENIKKLHDGQYASGGWPWFAGMPESRYITQYILEGFGHLIKLEALDEKTRDRTQNMTERAVNYVDNEMERDYRWIKAHVPDYKTKNNLSQVNIHYLYIRSFFNEQKMSKGVKEAYDYFMEQAMKYWLDYDIQLEAVIGLVAHRAGNKEIVKKISDSHKERAIRTDEMGMYWKEIIAGYWWYQAPVETQSLMIEFFNETGQDISMVDDMRIWLLRQKQTTDWKTTKATAEAVYALLLGGRTKFLDDSELPVITVGKETIKYDASNAEAGTGYIKKTWGATEVSKDLAKVSVTRKTEGFSWGALYWQYFEVPDKVTRSGQGLKVDKKMYRLKRSHKDNEAELLTDNMVLEPGDRIRHRLIISADRNYEFVHMKDMRAAGTEPIQVLSQYFWRDGLGFYQSTRDAATNFFFDYIPKGTYVIEYDLKVELRGEFSNGICIIQSMYAPEFAGHSNGSRLSVGKK
jgi:hypothetical protein